MAQILIFLWVIQNTTLKKKYIVKLWQTILILGLFKIPILEHFNFFYA